MAFPVSPAVVVREFDLTTVIPAVALTPAAIAGVFYWGPLSQITKIQAEPELRQRFGEPGNLNGETWFSASNFLAYGGNLLVVRSGDTTGANGEVFVASNTGNNQFLSTITTGVTNGMVLFFSNNIAAINPASNGGVIVTSVNSSVIVLSSPANSSTANVDLFFRDNKVYTAVAQETQTPRIAWSGQIVQNGSDYLTKDGTFDSSVQWVARYPGTYGNGLRISVCDSSAEWNTNTALISNTTYQNVTSTGLTTIAGSNVMTFTFAPANTGNAAMVTSANTQGGLVQALVANGDLIQVGNVSVGFQMMKVTSVSILGSTSNVFTFTVNTDQAVNIVANTYSNTMVKYWEFANLINKPPGQSNWQRTFGNTAAADELHLVVVDQTGIFSGTPGAVLESYVALSRSSDSILEGGQSNWYKTVVNAQSPYVRWASDRITATSNTGAFLVNSSATRAYSVQFYGGGDGLNESTVPISVVTNGYDYFNDPVNVDVGLIITGKARGIPLNSNSQLATYLINTIAESRKDCVVFCSPDYGMVVNNKGSEASAIVTMRNAMPSSSYGFMDSGYKLQYDKYNNVYRWIPLNGDIAGLATQTDATNDPWWSFAGFNRGNIKNVTKLAWNPKQGDRDTLYAADVNSVATFPGLGTVLFGDHTLLDKPSAFNRINVRRLFIVLEKAIATAAKFTLFEFNDDFTRSQFRAMIKPFLADVKSRRGLTDFLVVCDATNNTPQVVVSNQFKAAIYIKPNYSINWVILDFVAVPPTLQFSEVIGNYGG